MTKLKKCHGPIPMLGTETQIKSKEQVSTYILNILAISYTQQL